MLSIPLDRSVLSERLAKEVPGDAGDTGVFLFVFSSAIVYHLTFTSQ
jgi:hypothetical protein